MAANATAGTYKLACGHTRESFQRRGVGQPLYCIQDDAESKVAEVITAAVPHPDYRSVG